MKLNSVAISLLLFVAACRLGHSAPPSAEDVDSGVVEMTVKKDLVIIASTKSYDAAKRVATSAAEKLSVPLDLRGLTYNQKAGLSLPEQECRDEFDTYPCYPPRGRWDDGVYVSVEHTSGYPSLTPGMYIVVVANSDHGSSTVREALAHAQVPYPDAYIRTVDVYLGCRH